MKSVIKWTGSKRLVADFIVQYFPSRLAVKKFIEPFCGASYVAYAYNHPNTICSDIYLPLIKLWRLIRDNPDDVIKQYRLRYGGIKVEDSGLYYRIRNRFNQKQDPHDLLFLTRQCYNGLIRFNVRGEFNSSHHFSRSGIHPDKFEKIVRDWSLRIKHFKFNCADYTRYTTGFLFFDPPYPGSDTMWFGSFNFDKFFAYLESLDTYYAITFGSYMELPKSLWKRCIELPKHNSSYRRLKKKTSSVKDFLYLNY